jgi:hypothetical protein
MDDFNAFVSSEYPVLHSVGARDSYPLELGEDQVPLSLGLLVKGIPSFLATVPVERADLAPVTKSLERGNVRVAVVGISVNGADLLEEGAPEPEAWRPQSTGGPRHLPAAFLSLLCADGRRIGIARIVAREESASPEDVARFVLHQIAQGVQIPDLASTR